MENKDFDIEQARAFVKNVPWVTSKEYKDTFPHTYTTRDRVNDNLLFESFISFARKNAKLKYFYGNTYLYYELDGFEFWEMGRPLKAVVVLNKAIIDDSKSYRGYLPPVGAKEILLAKLIERDLYVDNLLSKNNLTDTEKAQLKFLLNSERKSGNIISHYNNPIRLI